MPFSLPSLSKSLRLTILAAASVAVSFAFAADSRAATIGAGPWSSCGISSAGALSCWGSDNQGALGQGAAQEPTYDPLPVSGLGAGVTDIAVGVGNPTACAVVSGAARCWGNNSYGKLGNGTTGGSSNTPVQVSGLESGVTKISVNSGHTCAVQNGAAKCWGSGDYGRLGYGDNADRNTPQQPAGLESGVTDIAAGGRHTCAIQNGTILCWGYNHEQALGHKTVGSPGYNFVPRPMDSPPSGRAVRIAAAAYTSCALMESGAVYCWGSNTYGKLGAGKTSAELGESTNPHAVTGLESGVSDIHTNANHLCAIKSGTAYCWGHAKWGKLGNGATTIDPSDSSVPVQVSNITGVTSIATGNDHTCAVASGKNYCWGTNRQRQLGSDRVETFSGAPVEVTGSTVPVATITTPVGPSKLSRSGVALLATVSCPAGATCSVAAPERVKVTIRRKTFRVKVLGAGSIPAGGKAKIRTAFGKKARKRLGGRTTTVKVRLTTTVNGVQKARTIRVKVKGRG